MGKSYWQKRFQVNKSQHCVLSSFQKIGLQVRLQDAVAWNEELPVFKERSNSIIIFARKLCYHQPYHKSKLWEYICICFCNSWWNSLAFHSISSTSIIKEMARLKVHQAMRGSKPSCWNTVPFGCTHGWGKFFIWGKQPAKIVLFYINQIIRYSFCVYHITTAIWYTRGRQAF